ncbi:MAG: aminotransferase class I/II-fold pyridoxal phosphate-dependent enzyme [Candidatus Heimdallarchaeaceae archaeon]
MFTLPNRVSFTHYGISRLKKKKEIAEAYNIPIDTILDLSGGDNLFIPPKIVQNLIIKEIQEIDPRESYPVNYSSFLTELSRFVGVNAEQVFTGISHNQLIQKTIALFVKPKDTILLLSPDKEIYRAISENLGLNIHDVILDSHTELNLNTIDSIIKRINPKLIVFSSPHYPTAIQFDQRNILSLIREVRIPVIVDESYVEFGKYSLLNQVKHYNNLIVVRTFAKAWGLGAFSCAYLVARESIVTKLHQQYLFAEIPPLHIIVTTKVLQSPYRFVEHINKFIMERKRVIEHLRMMSGITVNNSDTNFLFVKFKAPVDELYTQFLSKGIIVKTFKNSYPFPNHDKCFLVTLGEISINDRLIISIAEILESI